MKDYTEVPRHESYGLVRLSRTNGRMNLFGSPIVPNHFMTLVIEEGRQYHGLGTDREMGGPTIVEIAMSEMQFAELITTPNSGCGTPCTLVYAREGETVKRFQQPPAQVSEASRTREEFRKRVSDRMADMEAAKDRIEKLMEEGSLSSKRRKEISSEIESLMCLFTSSAPFFMERFEENAAKVVATAKAEISAHADLVSRQTGVGLLKSVPALEVSE